MSKYYQGRFMPKHPEKYVGDLNKIIYRSGWEFKLMKWFDDNPAVLRWASEEIVIPYISPVDHQVHRYYPDFVVLFKHKTGEEKQVVIEVKPDAQTKMPAKKSRNTKRYLNEIATYAVNQAKWEAATKWCTDRGFQFQVLTEKHLHV